MLQPSVFRALGGISAIALAAALPLSAQTEPGQVTGTVTSQETGQPLGAVQVYLDGTGRASITRTDGSFALSDVPPGTYTLVAQIIGYQQYRQSDVSVSAGSSASVNIALQTNVLVMQEIVATGLVDPVEGVRSPITVNRLDRQVMPVTAAGSAVANLQGRIAGVTVNQGSGQPGEAVNLMLRTPTSVTQTGNPLIVVDGVILGGNTSNIESLDIESMEVIKGAAAASLYGSRAAAGVIAITTNRGRGLAAGETRFNARTEIGRTETIRSVDVPTHHAFLVDDEQNPTTYVNAAGEPVGREDRVLDPGGTMDNPYPGPIFNNLESAYRPGNFQTHSLSMAQNAEDTNFALSVVRRVEQGALENNDGYEQNSFRVNLDHRFRNTVNLGVSAYHTRDERDNLTGAAAGFAGLLSAPVDVNIGERDQNGEFIRVVEGNTSAFENPLWFQGSRDDRRNRVRTLASGTVTWTPQFWVTFTGNVSYDRQDEEERLWVPKGTPISATSDDQSTGTLEFDHDRSDTFNAEAQVSFRRDFGPLNARTTFRGLMERDKGREFSADGTDFFVNIPDLDAAGDQTSDSNEDQIRSLGYLWDAAFDYDGKYIFTILGRRDGSSLFGPDNRWHSYYRVAGRWRLSEESWFALPNVDEFALSYARGTAGGRPGFAAQYETLNVGASGVSKETLGNTELRPEHTLEQEVSLDMVLFGRFGVDLTHSWQTTTEQLVEAAVPTITGFTSQWSNGGTVTGNTTELQVEAQVLQTPNFTWTSAFVADRSRGKIEDWPFPCQNPTWRFFCTGEGIYEIWGGHMLGSVDELETHHGGAAMERADEFQVNDDGYLVWVGAGNSYTDGLWGESAVIGGRAYQWGMPFLDANADGTGRRQQIGDASHVNLGWTNNFNYGNLSLHTQFHAAIGGDAINRSHQEMVTTRTYHAMDQSGKPEGLKKPIAYYTALEGGTGNDAWMENGDYLKLRTASINYRLGQEHLGRLGLASLGVESLSIGLIGRNIFTITDYTGFDPEQSLNLGNRQSQDRFSYPNTRNYTAEIQVTF